MTTTTATEYRAHDTVTGWQGPPRGDEEIAQADAATHNDGCAEQGGYGSAIVVVRDGGRCVDLDGQPVWPAHGRTIGAARWT